MTDNSKPPRSLQKLLGTYLKIIPDEETTKEYRDRLVQLKSNIESKDTTYWSPEVVAEFIIPRWEITESILQKYNPRFIEYDWAKAIQSICIYEYDIEEVKPYIDLLINNT